MAHALDAATGAAEGDAMTATPGPWMVWEGRNGELRAGPSPNCTVASLSKPPVGDVAFNARLIAAAPELLEALVDIHDYAHNCSTGPAVPDHFWEIRARCARAIDAARSKT